MLTSVPSPRAAFRAAALPALLLASGCGRPAQQAGFTPPPMPVEVAQVSPRVVEDRFTALGTVAAAETVQVVAEIDAQVAQLPFTEGAAVARGALLARLDDAQLKATLARALAQRNLARTNLTRIESLVGQSILPPQAQDDARAELQVTEADVALAEARLAKTEIRAPFAGVVGARRVSPGAFLHAGDVITDLSQVDEIKVTFNVPERYLAQLVAGSSVRLSSPAFPDAPLDATVTLVEPVLDPATRSARLTARAANPGLRFRPGMSADVAVLLASRPAALTVPNEAVFYEGAQALVYRVGPDGAVARAPIALGTRLSDVVEVTSGLEAGATVVRAGHQKLFDGARVAPVGGDAPASGG